MQETAVATPPPPRPRRFRWFLIVLFLLAASFLAGYVPQRIEANRAKEELAQVSLDHQLAELHRRLGVASHEAMRNNYASAAEAANAFFGGCSEFLLRYPMENEPRTRNAIASYAASRDAVMAQLAAADPAVRERLAGMFLAMDGVIARRQ
jgi:hypothetical protein